jgi:uncharacterized protein (DUF608 family)
MRLLSIRRGVFITLAAATGLWALAQTTGVPLGGMGTGYMIFNARTGQFASSGKVMPPGQRMESEFTNYQSSSCGFHFFANGSHVQKAKTNNEDAKCPVYTADFGATGGVNFKLTAFGPYIPGSNPLYEKLAQSPLALFDIQAENNNASACTVAVALEFANQNFSGTNSKSNSGTPILRHLLQSIQIANGTYGEESLLGGTIIGASDGNNAVTWAGATENAYMIVSCAGDTTGTRYASGRMGSFLTNGSLLSDSGNLVAAKCYVAANGTAHFRFVMSWYQQWTGPKGNEGHWYFNYYTNPASGSKDCAKEGMKNFDLIESGATSIKDRVMASNFPDWYKDRLLGNLYPMVHNIQNAFDGRTGMWEGEYPILGTLDQTQHSALWFVFNWPSTQWRELEFWARQQRTEPALLGQIHHDFNGCGSGAWDDYAHFFFAWDDITHADYWFQPNTTDWGDLQSMFIFKAYELMLATGQKDKDSLNKYWPYIKLASDRMINQCGISAPGTGNAHLANDAIHSSYDNGAAAAKYCASTELAAWEAVIEMAKFLGDDSTATRVQNWYDQGRAEFEPRFVNANFATGTSVSERDVAGYSWARYMCLPAIMDSNVIAMACSRLWTYYSSQGSVRAKLGNWHFYTYDHWGGAAIGIGDVDHAMTSHWWDYDYYYTQSPGYAHWQSLQNSNNSYHSYGTACCVWRSLFQMTGYLLDNANQRLWIRPMIPTSMSSVITDAPLINPNGWGTLNFNDSDNISAGVDTFYQQAAISFDSSITVREIVLKNDLPGSVTSPVYGTHVRISSVTSATVTVETRGNAFEKNLRITLDTPSTITIGPGGKLIQVGFFHTGLLPRRASFEKDNRDNKVHVMPEASALALSDSRISAGKPVHYSVANAGHVVLELVAINGAKINSIFSGNVSAGSHTAVWNGRSAGGLRIGSGIAVMRLISQAGVISKVVYIGK